LPKKRDFEAQNGAQNACAYEETRFRRSVLVLVVSQNFERERHSHHMCRYAILKKHISNLVQQIAIVCLLKVLAKGKENSQLADFRFQQPE